MRASKDPRACLRAWLLDGRPPEPDHPEQARALAQEAARQGLTAWLDEAVAAGAPGWSAPLRDELRQAHRRTFVETTKRIELARRALGLLDRAGIRAVPLKGVALVEDLYPTVAHRPMADADVLALEAPHDARDRLATGGFREIARADHAWVLEDEAGAGVVELHHSVTSCPGLFRIDADAVWRESRTTASGLRVPCTEHLLVQLALHAAFQHGLVLSLVQYLDFRRLLDHPIDTARVEASAAEMGATTALAFALAAAQRVVGAAVPPALLKAGAGNSWLQRHLGDPLASLEPAAPRLARARWECVPDRRLALLRATLLEPHPKNESAWSRGWNGFTRALYLARRSVH